MSENARKKPAPPGSDEALAKGCRCPVLDNHHGKGRYGDGAAHGWLVSGICGLHRSPMLNALLKALGEDPGE